MKVYTQRPSNWLAPMKIVPDASRWNIRVAAVLCFLLDVVNQR